MLIVGVVLIIMGAAGWTIAGIDNSLTIVGIVLVTICVINWIYAAVQTNKIMREIKKEEEEQR
jgi:hypothetical protein